MAATATAMDSMARGKPRLPLQLNLAMAMAAMDTMASTARGRLRQLLWLLLSQKLLLSLATDTMADTAMVATEVMAMADMVTTASTARGPLMPTMATDAARDLQMPTTDTEDTVDMAMATAMDMDTMD